ncbi:hypothetical protein [Oricola sp.]|uniref:hypothetical protein n=1 Tax=Oricola sp. TaxID=1979950 RepID=UPI003BAA4ADE
MGQRFFGRRAIAVIDPRTAYPETPSQPAPRIARRRLKLGAFTFISYVALSCAAGALSVFGR